MIFVLHLSWKHSNHIMEWDQGFGGVWLDWVCLDGVIWLRMEIFDKTFTKLTKLTSYLVNMSNHVQITKIGVLRSLGGSEIDLMLDWVSIRLMVDLVNIDWLDQPMWHRDTGWAQ